MNHSATAIATPSGEPPEEMITIPKKEYNSLKFSEAQLLAMEAAGVDNWQGYDEVNWPHEEDFDL